MPSGVMVCLALPPVVAQCLAVEGGEPVENLHVTVAYVPGIAGDREKVARLVEELAPLSGAVAPLAGCVGGTGRFNASQSSDGMDVFYASFDSPGLEALRTAVMAAVDRAGLGDRVARAHGFTPHITLAYLDPDDPTPVLRPALPPFECDTLAVADNRDWTHLRLGGTIVLKGARAMKSQPSGGDVHVPSAMAPATPKKKKRAESADEGGGQPAVPVAVPPAAQTGGSDYAFPENNQGVGYRPRYKSAKARALKALGLVRKDLAIDVADALAEVAQTDDTGIEEATAAKWCSRALAVLQLAAHEEDDSDRAELIVWAEDLYHEALEHAALVKDGGDTVAQVQELVEPAFESVEKSEARALADAALMASVELRGPIRIAKAVAAKQIVYGVVLEPGSEDLQGDVMDEEDIETTAHDYMVAARHVARRHQDRIDAVPVESYIAPQDFQLGTEHVRKGSWVLGVKVRDPGEWEKVASGQYSGFSVGGVGVREQL